MSDLIRRQDAIDALSEDVMGGLNYRRILQSLPSADAVEVVRCKDCYHAEDDITHMFCVYFHHKVYEDDYCSNAVERIEDGEEEC